MSGQPYRCSRCGDIHGDDTLMPDCLMRELVESTQRVRDVVCEIAVERARRELAKDVVRQGRPHRLYSPRPDGTKPPGGTITRMTISDDEGPERE